MWLTVSVGGQQVARRGPVAGSPVLGRAPDCDVVIDDGRVSQRHARLDVGPGGAWVTDLDSTNGTYVDGTRVAGRAWVPVNGEVQVGRATLRLCDDQPTEVFSPGAPHAPPHPYPPPPPPRPTYRVADAGPVAGRDVRMDGHQVVGRDLVIHEGMKLRTRMRGSAKALIRLGIVAFLVGTALVGYFVITWNNEIFDAVRQGPEATTQPDLPSPMPWLPLGFGLSFGGMVMVVAGLLVPRDRIVTRGGR